MASLPVRSNVGLPLTLLTGNKKFKYIYAEVVAKRIAEVMGIL